MEEKNPNPSIIERMLEHRYLVFAPKDHRDLRTQYPELMDYDEFKSHILKQYDALFVWWYSSQTSPLYSVDDAVKMDECIHLAYPNAQQREAKKAEFSQKIPDNIKRAMKRMESFNTSTRVENYVQTIMVRENCKAMLAEDVEAMTTDQKDAWASRAPKLWKLMEETSKAIERGAYGVVASEDTLVNEADGALKAFRQSRSGK